MSFDALAPHYRWMEFVLAGEKLQRCRTAFLAETSGASQVLILGEGHGRFLVECRRLPGAARITCVDASQPMLQKARAARQRGLSEDRVEFLHVDALTWQPPNRQFDTIVTHFFLDCFRPEQLSQLVEKISACAAPNAKWLLADFQRPPSGLAKVRASLILWSMYLFFRLVTRLPASRWTEPAPFLKQHGFRLRQRQVSEWGLLRSDLWERVKS